MFVIATVNPETGRPRKSPDIISRGFVYLQESRAPQQAPSSSKDNRRRGKSKIR